MSHSLPLEDIVSRLTGLFTINNTYTLTFDQHSATDVLIEARKSKGKDQDKKVTKVDGKLVPCWMLKFEQFECFLQLNKIQDIRLTAKGAKIIFETYELDVECKS